MRSDQHERPRSVGSSGGRAASHLVGQGDGILLAATLALADLCCDDGGRASHLHAWGAMRGWGGHAASAPMLPRSCGILDPAWPRRLTFAGTASGLSVDCWSHTSPTRCASSSACAEHWQGGLKPRAIGSGGAFASCPYLQSDISLGQRSCRGLRARHPDRQRLWQPRPAHRRAWNLYF